MIEVINCKYNYYYLFDITFANKKTSCKVPYRMFYWAEGDSNPRPVA